MITVMLFIAFPRLLPYSGLFSRRLYSRISRKHSQSSKIKIVKKIINVEEAWFSISIREITFREQELNWLFAKYKRLENNPLYGISIVLLAPCIWGGCGYNSEYLWRTQYALWRTYGRMPPMQSLQELRTLPNELLLVAWLYVIMPRGVGAKGIR